MQFNPLTETKTKSANSEGNAVSAGQLQCSLAVKAVQTVGAVGALRAAAFVVLAN